MSETLLGLGSQESRLKRKREERLERERLERERLERERLKRERRERAEAERFVRDRIEKELEKERAKLFEKEGFSIPEACLIIGAGRSSVYEALNAGELTARKMGRRTIILKQELLRFLSELPAANFGIKQPDALESRPAGSGEVAPRPRSPKVKQRSAAVSMSAQT